MLTGLTKRQSEDPSTLVKHLLFVRLVAAFFIFATQDKTRAQNSPTNLR